MGGVIVLAALLGSAHAQDLWSTLIAAAPPSCRIDAADAALRIDCGGAALLVEPPAAGHPDPRQVALEAQLAPFWQAPGITISAPEATACSLDGVMVDCLAAQVVVGTDAGAVLHVLSGQLSGGGPVGTCLYRGAAGLPEVCAGLFTEEPH